MEKDRPSLPIDPYLEQLVTAGRKNSVLLVKAPPGTGKTTRLPWAIAKVASGKVLALEPRRLAAKLAAERIAFEEDIKIGAEVGYHFRFEKKITDATKLIFYTEGTFLKSLAGNPDLLGIDTVLIDEFHERHLETDVALAYLRALQTKRPDLKIVLMSATLDTKVVDALPGAESIEIQAKHYHVDIHYLPNQPSVLNRPLEQKVRQAIESSDPKGDVLVFLPGMREMLKVKDTLGTALGEVVLLHAELSKDEQELALTKSNRRRIVLATNVAESSVTIPGITVVVDSGIQREAHYSPWNGLKLVADRPTTQSSAIQRAGRAGRTADGACFRLYAEQDYNERVPYTVPEVLRADLTDSWLMARELGRDLNWFTPPPPERWQKAGELAYRLGAVDEKNNLTKVGHKLLTYPLGARLSRALLAGEDLPKEEKRKLLNYICDEIEQDKFGTLKRRLDSYLRTEGKSKLGWEQCLLTGFVDQVARWRPKQRDFIHYSGKTIKAHPKLDLHQEFYIVLDITQRQEAISVLPIEEEWLYDLDPFPFTEEEDLEVDGDKMKLFRRTKLGSILMDEAPVKLELGGLSSDLKAKIALQGQRPFEKKLLAFKEGDAYLRLHFWARHKNLDLEAAEKALDLGDYLDNHGALDWSGIDVYFRRRLEESLAVGDLERELPDTVRLEGKREIKVHYPYGLEPYVEAPIQDFYGVKETPTIGKDRIKLTMKLLGPHKRPLQVTKDIMGFWQKTYQEMKKELMRDYPRHHWPDKPESAPPVLLKRQLQS